MALSHVFPALLLLVAGTSAEYPIGSVRGITPLSCYKLYTRPASYLDAQATCQRDYGYLVSVSNRNVERDLRTLTTEYGSATRYWLGATQTDGYGWSWTAGSPWYHPQWAAGKNDVT
ncbi:perlucin A2 protein precursor [Aphelenchoides avenae]|nr:perlucin A2 protein precursor [Aphelenchus avenae]